MNTIKASNTTKEWSVKLYYIADVGLTCQKVLNLVVLRLGMLYSVRSWQPNVAVVNLQWRLARPISLYLFSHTSRILTFFPGGLSRVRVNCIMSSERTL